MRLLLGILLLHVPYGIAQCIDCTRSLPNSDEREHDGDFGSVAQMALVQNMFAGRMTWCTDVSSRKIYRSDHSIVIPKAFRVGAAETVVLNLHGYTRATVSAYLQDMPNKINVFSQINGMVLDNEGCNAPIPLTMSVQRTDIPKFRNRQTVLLTVQVSNSDSDFEDTVEVFVSKTSGYLFIVTDRPIYKPNDKVKIRVFPLDQSMISDRQTVEITVKTPDGIGVEKYIQQHTPQSFITANFRVAENPVFGTWSVEVKYIGKGFETTDTTTFLVQRYVLPTFQVRVEPCKSYILVSDQDIEGTIYANYSYGKPVHGSYFLSMKLKKTPDSVGIEFYTKPGNYLKTALFHDGRHSFSAAIQFLNTKLGQDETVTTLATNGGSIYIEATVSGRAEGVLESAVTADIPFVQSPFKIDQSRVVKHYAPNLPYVIQVDTRDIVNGKPIPNLAVYITVPGEGDETKEYESVSDANGQINFQVDFIGNGRQSVTVKTQHFDLEDINQATAQFDVDPYLSPSNSFLQIRANKHVVNVGGQLTLTFNYFPNTPENTRYFVISRGSTVFSGVHVPQPGAQESTERITITHKMVPSIRIVAYYLRDNEVVSVSLWINVVNQCRNELVVTVPEEVIPGESFNVDLRGAPNTLVSVIGVDRAAYFLHNSSRLTRNSMFDKMQSFDQGCALHGGKNGPDVFTGAGLLLATNNVEPIEVRTLSCDQPQAGKRRKRNVDDGVIGVDREASLAKCERQGKLISQAGEDCGKRARRCRDNYEHLIPGCFEKFLNGCIVATRERFFAKLRGGAGRNFNREAADERAAIARQRSDFQESLLFATHTLNDEGSISFPTSSRDSVTTFDIDAVSMQQEEDGFCISKPAQLRTFKNVFIKMYVPYSLKKGEQAIIRISVFNYDSTDHSVSLEVQPDKNLCTQFKSGIWSPLAVIGALRNRAAPASINVFPLKIPITKRATIQLRALDIDGSTLDSVEHKILIEEPGEVKDITGSFPIDLRRDRQMSFDMNFFFPELFVAGSRQCWLYAYTNFLGPSIEVDPISKEPKVVALRKPYGCGEQTMLTAGPNTYMHFYYVSTNKMVVGSPQHTQSINFMKTAFNREMQYRSDHVGKRAWAVWSNVLPSTWLNAFVNKVFGKMKLYYTDMDVTPVCNSLEWLLTQQELAKPPNQQGFFSEQRPPYHREMHGAVGGRLTLTAYVVISFLETQSFCLPELNMKIQQSTATAIAYLKNNKDNPTFHRPYALALLTYTLALCDPDDPVTSEMNTRLLALKKTTTDHRQVHWKGSNANQLAGTDIHAYWYQTKPLAVDVETTAYALLAQVTLAKYRQPVRQEDLDSTRKIMLWLVSQRNEGGAFISTQDTVIGLQAMATYKAWVGAVEVPALVNNIDLKLGGAEGTTWKVGSEYQATINEDNEGFKLQIDVPDDVMKSETVSVTATGTGEGVMSYRCIYRTMVDEEACYFDLAIDFALLDGQDLEEDFPAPMKYKITITVSKPVGDQAEMAIIDVGLMSGFSPIIDTLENIAIAKAVDGTIDRYEASNQNVILYLRRITNEPLTIVFHMEQLIAVDKPQPAKVNVYDYYEPSVFCGKFYSLPDNTPELRTSNCEADANAELCRCAEGGCPVCRTREEQLRDTMCMDVDDNGNCLTCESDFCHDMYQTACASKYAIVVEITDQPQDNTTDVFVEFTGTVIKSLLKGVDTEVRTNHSRTFTTRTDCSRKCRDAAVELNIKNNPNESLSYLKTGVKLYIVGSLQESYRTKSGHQGQKYLLTEETFVERYIPQHKCELARYNLKNKGCDKAKPDSNKAKKCDKWKKTDVACKTMEKLITKLREGCN